MQQAHKVRSSMLRKLGCIRALACHGILLMSATATNALAFWHVPVLNCCQKLSLISGKQANLE